MTPMTAHALPPMRLLVGGTAATIQGEPCVLGDGTEHMFTAAHSSRKNLVPRAERGALDSGAFTDPPHKRLTPDLALERQLRWETDASHRWGVFWQATALVSYDLLIDETWVAGVRHKRRWSIAAADRAVAETVGAARYLASARDVLAPRTLILSCQGVDALQYTDCALEVLRVAEPGDWLGLGGWCILGRHTSLLPAFWQTLYRVLPLVALSGVTHVHIFGVLYLPALGGLQWLCDHYGLTVSTDSTAPVLACTWKGATPEETAAKLKKAGARRPYWRDNVAWWQSTLATLRDSTYYRQPPEVSPSRQLEMVWEMAV